MAVREKSPLVADFLGQETGASAAASRAPPNCLAS